MNFIDGWDLVRVCWQFILDFLDWVIPLILPDGTQFGAKTFFAFLGILADFVAGNKLQDFID